MSQSSRAIFAALAVSLTFGAMQLASGRDLGGISPDPSSATEASINREAKTDRAMVAAGPAAQTQTVSLRLDSLADTSILIRLPVARPADNTPVRKEARNGFSSPVVAKSGNRTLTVACEPVVSVLTEVAKLLQPGRCVT